MSYGYAYDAIGNRTQTQVNGANATYVANALNQYQSRDVPGRAEVQGDVASAPSTNLIVGINGIPVTPDAHGHFYKALPADNTTSPRWQETRVIGAVKSGGVGGKDVAEVNSGHVYVPRTPEAIAFDADGNQTSDGRWLYAWDAENRLSSVMTQPSAVTAGVPAGSARFQPTTGAVDGFKR